MALLSGPGKKGTATLSDFDAAIVLKDIIPGFEQSQEQLQPTEQKPQIQLTQKKDRSTSSLADFDPNSVLQGIIPGFGTEQPSYLQKQGINLQDEGWLDWAKRNIAGAAQSIGGALVGLPGSIQELPLNIGESIGRAIYGSTPEYEEFAKTLRGQARGMLTKEFGFRLPTTGEVKGAVETVGEKAFDIPREYWDPKTPGESEFRRILESATSYAHPVLGGVKLATAITTPLIGLSLRKGAEKVGAPEWVQELAGGLGEITYMGISSGDFVKKINEKFKKTEELVPSSIVGDARKLQKNLKTKSFELEKAADITKAEKFLEDRMRSIKQKIYDGEMNVRDALIAKRKLSEHAFDFAGNNYKKMQNIKPHLKFLNDNLNDFLVSYGKEYNPAFLKAFTESNKMYSDLKNITNTIEKVKKSYGSKAGVVGLGIVLGKKAMSGILGAVALIKGLKDTGKIAKVFFNSKAMRNHYFNGIRLATKDKLKEASVQFQKMEKQLEKDFPGITEKISQLPDQ